MSNTEKILEEIRANTELNAIYTKAVSGQMLEDNELSLILPFLPEFRDSMEKAEHARAEGRTTRLEDAQAALRKLDASMVKNLPTAVLNDLRLLVDFALSLLSFEDPEEVMNVVTWFDQVVSEGLERAEDE